jgi:hypothetical protein
MDLVQHLSLGALLFGRGEIISQIERVLTVFNSFKKARRVNEIENFKAWWTSQPKKDKAFFKSIYSGKTENETAIAFFLFNRVLSMGKGNEK